MSWNHLSHSFYWYRSLGGGSILSRSLRLGSRNVCGNSTYRSDFNATQWFPSFKRYTKFRNCASHINRSLWSRLLTQLERWMSASSLVRSTTFVRESISQFVWPIPASNLIPSETLNVLLIIESRSSFILGHIKDFYSVGFMRNFLEICSFF